MAKVTADLFAYRVGEGEVTVVAVTVVIILVVVEAGTKTVGGTGKKLVGENEGNVAIGTPGNANCCKCGDGVATPSRMYRTSRFLKTSTVPEMSKQNFPS